MAEVRSWPGLDVYARTVLAVTLDAESAELRSARLSGETARAVEFYAGRALRWAASDAGGA